MFLRAFINNGGTYFLTEIKIYRDGMIDCWDLVDLSGFKQKVSEGWVVTTLPPDACVSISFLTVFTVKKLLASIHEDEFIKEVADEIERLNGRQTTRDKCLLAYQHYQNEPTEESRRALREAYEAVPEHHRRSILGDMDLKDGPIRRIIYENESE